MYAIQFTDQAQQDATLLRKNAPNAYRKLMSLLDELREHPRTGTGKVERLRHYPEETWSRRINREHRLVYRVYDEVVQVIVIAAYGHYE